MIAYVKFGQQEKENISGKSINSSDIKNVVPLDSWERKFSLTTNTY